MKTTKLFFMAALALMTAACSNDDNDFQTPAPQPQKAERITITATLAPKTSTAASRAVSDGGSTIVSTWAENEHIAVLYTKDETQYAADATVTGVDGSGAATIEFEVESGTADNTACTLVYPYTAAKDDHSGVKDAATLLAAQDGTLNANLDVRVGAGTIQTSTPGLTVTTQPAAQYAIFKFTTKTSDGGATIAVKPLVVSIGTLDFIITPSSATSEIYAALPPISTQDVRFTATGDDSNTYMNSKTGVSFSAGKYYQSVVKLNSSSLKYMIIPKSSTDLSGDKLFYYAEGETYKEAINNNSENKFGDLRWGIWDGGSDATIYFKEVSGVARDLSIDGYQHFGTSQNKDGITVNTVINPNKNYYFVGSF